MSALYLDTSAVLRAVLEEGAGNEVEERIAAADLLVTSRLALVESARAFHRLRQTMGSHQASLADAERSVAAVWSRCVIWELGPPVCDLAGAIAQGQALGALDALHLATFVLARRELGELELLTTDERLASIAGAA